MGMLLLVFTLLAASVCAGRVIGYPGNSVRAPVAALARASAPASFKLPGSAAGRTVESASAAGVLGDVNGDDVVDSTDALIVLSADAGMNTSQFCPMNCGDTNADGFVDSTDALIILSYDAGMTVQFPVGQPECPSSVTQPAGCSSSWIQTNWPAGNSYFSLYASQDKVFARIWDAFNGGRVFLTADDGANWAQISSAEPDIDILSIVMVNSDILAGTWEGFYRSADIGETWDALTPAGVPAGTAISALALLDTTLYAGTTGHIYKSIDNGDVWTEVSTGLGAAARILSFVASGDSVYAGSASHGVFKKTGAESSWAAVNSGITDLHISQLAVLGTRLFAVTLTGVFISDNGGTSWAADGSGLEDVNCLAVVGSQLYAGTDAGGAYLSVDSGATWTAVATGMPAGSRVWSLAASSGSLFAGTDSGVWVFR